MNIKSAGLDLLALPPQAWQEVSTGEDVLDREVKAKENITNNNPGQIVDYELGSLINMTFILQKDKKSWIVKKNEVDDDTKVESSLIEFEQISVVLSSKSGKSFHVQVLSFHIFFAVFSKSKHENKEQKGCLSFLIRTT